MKIWKIIATTAIAFGLSAGAAFAQVAPDALVKSVAEEVLTTIRNNKDIQNDPKKLGDLLEAKLLPNFNFARMTQLAMGRNWNKATPEQQKALTAEFKTLLVRTYSGALATYKDNTIEYKPLKAKPEDKEVIVRTQVVKPGSQPIPIDYSMENTPEGWKAYDVVVGGVSLVTNYREEFNNAIRESGVDGLLKLLATKNKAGEKK